MNVGQNEHAFFSIFFLFLHSSPSFSFFLVCKIVVIEHNMAKVNFIPFCFAVFRKIIKFVTI